MAKALQKPFYVAAESYKFARMYPLSQRDAITSAAAATSAAVSVAKVFTLPLLVSCRHYYYHCR